MQPEHLENRLRLVARVASCIDLDDYLASVRRELWGFLVLQDHVVPFMGTPSAGTAEAIMAAGVFSAEAGYRVDAGPSLALTVNADVLLIKAQRLEDPPAEIDGLLVHETVHLVLDAGLQSPIADPTDVGVRELGSRIHRWSADDDYHNRRFFTSLVEASRRWAASPYAAASTAQVLRNALRFDIPDIELTDDDDLTI